MPKKKAKGKKAKGKKAKGGGGGNGWVFLSKDPLNFQSN